MILSIFRPSLLCGAIFLSLSFLVFAVHKVFVWSYSLFIDQFQFLFSATPNNNKYAIGKLDGETLANFKLSEDVLNVSYPLGEDGKFSRCEYFTDNFYAENRTVHDTVPCSDYVWDTSKYESSAIKTFDLICDRSDLKPRADALFMAGVFMGSFLFGHLSDKYGRRKVFVLSLVCQLAFGLLMAFAYDFVSFTAFRMVRQILLVYSLPYLWQPRECCYFSVNCQTHYRLLIFSWSANRWLERQHRESFSSLIVCHSRWCRKKREWSPASSSWCSSHLATW